jgi:hypothetical protein
MKKFLIVLLLISGCDHIVSVEDAGDDDGGIDTAEDAATDDNPCVTGHYDWINNLCWSDDMGVMDRSTGLFFCMDLEIDNATDWRLPSRNDFVDLLAPCDADVQSGNAGFCQPCSDAEVCGSIFPEEYKRYLSSDYLDETNPTLGIWSAHFALGYILPFPDNLMLNIKCVYNP